jgi:hypothetical protein
VLVLASFAAVACGTVLGFDPLHADQGADAPDVEAGNDGASADAASDVLAVEPALSDSSSPSDGAVPSCAADLTRDSKHCGRCGHDCLGGECLRGVCQAVKLADGLAMPEGIAVSDTSVFVAEYRTNRIIKFVKTDVPSICTRVPEPAQCVFLDDVASVFKPTAVTVSGDRVYWANSGNNSVHEIRSCPVSGCGGKEALLVASLSHYAFDHLFGTEVLPLDLVVRNGRVYWPESGNGALRSAPIDGGAVTTYLESGSFMPVAIAVDDTNVYFTDDTNQHPTRIQAAPLDGRARDGGVQVLASTPSRPFGLALASSGTLFWTVRRVEEVGDGLVQSAPKAGLPNEAEPDASFAREQVEPTHVIVDAKNVYWVQGGSDDAATGMVLMCPQTGCPADGPVVLAAQQNVPRHLTADANAIYWSNEGLPGATTSSGQVWKVAKP